jgi:hypothetical protein
LRSLIKSYYPLKAQKYSGALHLGLIIYRVVAKNIIGALHLVKQTPAKKAFRNPFPDRIYLTQSSRGAIIFVEPPGKKPVQVQRTGIFNFQQTHSLSSSYDFEVDFSTN